MVTLSKKQYVLIAGAAQVPLSIALYYIFVELLSSDASGLSEAALILSLAGSLIPFSFIAVSAVFGFLLQNVGVKKSYLITIPAGLITAAVAGLELGELNLLVVGILLSAFSVLLYSCFQSLQDKLSSRYLLIALAVGVAFSYFAVAGWNAVNANQTDLELKKSVDFTSYYSTELADDSSSVRVFIERRGGQVNGVRVTQPGRDIEIFSSPADQVDFVDLNPPERCSITDSYLKRLGLRTTTADEDNGCIEHTTAGGRVFYEEVPEIGAHQTFYTVIDDIVVYVYFDKISSQYTVQQLPRLKAIFDSLEMLDQEAIDTAQVF